MHSDDSASQGSNGKNGHGASDVAEALSIVPPGWLRDYVAHASGCTDAPAIYHVACGLGVVAAVIAPHLDLSLEGVLHPLHLWILLLGRSSDERKSTSLGIADGVLRRACLIDGREPDWFLLPELATPEALISVLHDRGQVHGRAHGLLIASEFAVLLGQTQASYWRHYRMLLPRLYDGTGISRARRPNESERGRSGLVRESVIDPRLTILGASALDPFERASDRTDWHGGFFPRFLMFPARRARSQPSQRDVGPERDRLASGLLQIRDGARDASLGLITFGREAAERYAALEETLPQVPDPVRAARARAPEHAIRLAAILELAGDPSRREVGLASVEAAYRIVRLALRSLGRLAEEMCVADASGAEVPADERARQVRDRRVRLWRLICRAAEGDPPTVGWSQAIWRSHMPLRVFTETMEAIVDVGLARVVAGAVGKGKGGRQIVLQAPEEAIEKIWGRSLAYPGAERPSIVRPERWSS